LFLFSPSFFFITFLFRRKSFKKTGTYTFSNFTTTCLTT
jgi:hypothetical protein